MAFTLQSNLSTDTEAVTELMKPKAKPSVDASTRKTTWHGTAGLGAYTVAPETFPSDRVLYYNDKFVVINDLYPKARVHLLILPRDPAKNTLSPQDAFDDPVFLKSCQEELVKVRKMVASELRRRFGKQSRSDREYFRALEEEDPPEELPQGRDWEKDVISGIHAIPSMDHVHIHVLSPDMSSVCMRKKPHYLSFTTDFLVDLDQFPLAQDDHRRDYQYFTKKDMICWRCRANFGNKFTKLEEHLEQEFEAWIKE